VAAIPKACVLCFFSCVVPNKFFEERKKKKKKKKKKKDERLFVHVAF
jgi:hypothetical protein